MGGNVKLADLSRPPLIDPPSHNTVTSILAAESVKPHASRLRDEVYAAIAAAPDGLTCDELTGVLDLEIQTVTPRVNELMRAGRIRRQGTRPTRRGRPANVWVAAEPEVQ
jgi:predicted ArsR family transcriptional regulator